ncbi:MAG: hypothetical protein MZV64_17995 [Ignavibacteriales bacterium]|nr:hypothetical protein [Ignavibacteriales bacterium]
MGGQQPDAVGWFLEFLSPSLPGEGFFYGCWKVSLKPPRYSSPLDVRQAGVDEVRGDPASQRKLDGMRGIGEHQEVGAAAAQFRLETAEEFLAAASHDDDLDARQLLMIGVEHDDLQQSLRQIWPRRCPARSGGRVDPGWGGVRCGTRGGGQEAVGFRRERFP